MVAVEWLHADATGQIAPIKNGAARQNSGRPAGDWEAA